MMRVGLVVVAGLALGACFNPSFDHPQCGPAGECPSGSVCVAGTCQRDGVDVDSSVPIDATDAAVDATDAAVDATDAAIDATDAAIDATDAAIDARPDAAIDAAIDAATDAPVAMCGNSVPEAGEQCDDGNASNTDGCLNTCMLARCGDGFIRAGIEVCDDRNSSACGTCNATCSAAITPRPATGMVMVVTAGNHLDGELLVIDDGINPPTTFEYDRNGAVGSGNIRVSASGGGPGVMGDVLTMAINSAPAPLAVTATHSGGGQVGLTHDRNTAAGNRPLIETVADSMFIVGGMSGGAAGDCLRNTGCVSGSDCLSGVCVGATLACQ